MRDSLVMAMPDTHPLAGDSFISLSNFKGTVLPDRLRGLAQNAGFVADIVQVAPDTQTALALVSAEVGCHLTLSSVALNATDPHVVFAPLEDSIADVDLRAAWRPRRFTRGAESLSG
jgi:DNA-binding transcriptional LysR family regulator